MAEIRSVTFSFDDGHYDNLRVIEDIMIPYNIPATFNITTGFIEGRMAFDSSLGAMSKSDIVDIYQNALFEIAAHGDFHQNTDEDIVRGRKMLIDWLGLDDDYRMGFASPNSKLSPTDICIRSNELRKFGFSYVRTGPDIKTLHYARLFCRRFSRIIHSATMYKVAYKDTIQSRPVGFLVLAVPVLHEISVRQVMSLVESIGDNDSLTLMFHSVKKKGEIKYDDNWSWDYYKFCELVRQLGEMRDMGKISIVTTAKLVKQV